MENNAPPCSAWEQRLKLPTTHRVLGGALELSLRDFKIGWMFFLSCLPSFLFTLHEQVTGPGAVSRRHGLRERKQMVIGKWLSSPMLAKKSEAESLTSRHVLAMSQVPGHHGA